MTNNGNGGKIFHGYIYIYKSIKIGSTKHPRERMQEYQRMKKRKQEYDAVFEMNNMECYKVDEKLKKDKNRGFLRYRDLEKYKRGGTELYEPSNGNSLKDDLIAWFIKNDIDYDHTFETDPDKFPSRGDYEQELLIKLQHNRHNEINTDNVHERNNDINEDIISLKKEINQRMRQLEMLEKMKMIQNGTKYGNSADDSITDASPSESDEISDDGPLNMNNQFLFPYQCPMLNCNIKLEDEEDVGRCQEIHGSEKCMKCDHNYAHFCVDDVRKCVDYWRHLWRLPQPHNSVYINSSSLTNVCAIYSPASHQITLYRSDLSLILCYVAHHSA